MKPKTSDMFGLASSLFWESPLHFLRQASHTGLSPQHPCILDDCPTWPFLGERIADVHSSDEDIGHLLLIKTVPKHGESMLQEELKTLPRIFSLSWEIPAPNLSARVLFLRFQKVL